jgi:PAP2 superfamily
VHDTVNGTQQPVRTYMSRREALSKGLQCMTIGAGLLLNSKITVVQAEGTPTHSTAAPDTLISLWNNAALQMIRVTHPGPPITARALAIVHTSIYDAWAAYNPVATGTRLGAKLRRPASEHTLANKQKAVSYAAYGALASLFPDGVPQFNTIMQNLGYNPADTSTDISTPSGVGNVAAQAVMAFRDNDGANQLGNLHVGAYSDYLNYVPKNTPDSIKDPNSWQPLLVSDGHNGQVIQKYTTACCGFIAPFALNSGAQFRPGPPATYPSPAYLAQAMQILNYSANLTDTQKVIAEYWADGPSTDQPPGHWNLFAQFVAQRDHYDLDTNVKLFFILTNAIFDAGIAAWDCKLFYNSVRPITAIHYLFNKKQVKAWAGPNKGTQLIQGQDWLPYQAATVVTPAFPEHVSGHSIFSASGATVLKRFTGSDSFGFSHTVKAQTSLFEPGLVPAQDITLSYPTFSGAADEAGLSRRYGGIHFEHGDLTGRAMGPLVADQAWNKALAYIHGKI